MSKQAVCKYCGNAVDLHKKDGHFLVGRFVFCSRECYDLEVQVDFSAREHADELSADAPDAVYYVDDMDSAEIGNRQDDDTKR